MKLHLGVVDFPHSGPGSKSTGDVAEILESKYHIMAIFFELHAPIIAGLLEESMAGALENMMMGAPESALNTLEAESAIGNLFRAFVVGGGLNGRPGVPTRAAMRGVSHRFKHPYAKRGPRPSFIDTGTYVAAFRAWVDGGLESAGGSAGSFAAGRGAGGAAAEADAGAGLAEAMEGL